MSIKNASAFMKAGCVGLGIEGFFKPEYIRDYYNDYFAMLRALD